MDGECHSNPLPDRSPCHLAGQSLPNPADLPAGHRIECYAEVCVTGQCVIDTSLQDGNPCDDGETTCTRRGACRTGECVVSQEARGYGETCQPRTADGIHALLGDLNARLGITAVVVTHNERLAASLPRRLHLTAGRLERENP